MASQGITTPTHDVYWGVDMGVQLPLADLDCRVTNSTATVTAACIRTFERCPFCGHQLGDRVFK